MHLDDINVPCARLVVPREYQSSVRKESDKPMNLSEVESSAPWPRQAYHDVRRFELNAEVQVDVQVRSKLGLVCLWTISSSYYPRNYKLTNISI
jgi:hypothetical protein